MTLIDFEVSESDIKRFNKFIDIKGEDDCWEWKGKRTGGYGRFILNRNFKFVEIIASRVAWVIEHGNIPKGLFVLHKCDNPPCVNPNHLFLGTQRDNMQDRRKKSRFDPSFKGENHYHHKLTTKDVMEIKTAHKNKSHRQFELAKLYNVDTATIAHIIMGRSWKHIQV